MPKGMVGRRVIEIIGVVMHYGALVESPVCGAKWATQRTKKSLE